MELLIVRHGRAEMSPQEGLGPPLSPQGMEDVERVAQMVAGQEVAPELLISSPLIRAKQTAEIFSKNWNLHVEEVDWLLPGVEASKIIIKLQEFGKSKPALVGHLPTLGWLLSVLVWGLPPKEIPVPKGSVTCLDIKSWEPSGGKIRWMVHPELKWSF